MKPQTSARRLQSTRAARGVAIFVNGKVPELVQRQQAPEQEIGLNAAGREIDPDPHRDVREGDHVLLDGVGEHPFADFTIAAWLAGGAEARATVRRRKSSTQNGAAASDGT